MISKKITKNYLYNTAYQILLVITPLLTAPYIARTLGVTAVSTVNYAYSVVAMFILFGTFGTTLFGQREIAYYKNDPVKMSEVFKEIMTLRAIAVGIVIVVYLCSVVSFSKYRTVYLFLIFDLFGAMVDVSWLFQGMENFQKTAIRNMVVKILSVALIFIFVKSPDDVNKYAVCFTLPTLLGNLSLWMYVPKVIQKSPYKFSSVIGYIKPMLALFLPQIAADIYTIVDKTMIGMLASDFNDVGYYTYSQHIVKMLLQPVISLGIVALPAMAAAFAEDRKDDIRNMMSDSFKFVFVLGCPMAFGIGAVAKSVVSWFYGPGYEKVAPLMAIICPIIVLIGISSVIGRQFLLPCNRQTAYTVSVLSGTATNLVLNFALIIPFGAVGASVATVISELTVVTVQIIAVRQELPVFDFFKANIRYLLFAAIMFAVVYPVNYLLTGVACTAVQVAAGVVVYGGLLLLTKDPVVYRFFTKIKERFSRG